MAIAFTQIPENLLVPGMYQEIDNSLAGSTSDVKKALMVATKAAAGTAAAGVAVAVRSTSKARTLFGSGSPASIMAAAFLSGNTTEELWVLPIEEPSAGAKWSKPFTVAVNNAAESTLTVTINGKCIDLSVTAGASAANIAAAIVAAINGSVDCPVEAEVDTENPAIVTVASITKGVTGNSNKVTITSTAAGVTVTAGDVTSGTGVPDLTAVLKGLGSIRYNYMATEFSDITSIKAIAAELEDRYSALRQIGGRCFVPISGDVGDASTEGSILYQAESVNSPHIILVPRGLSVQLPCVWAAVWCAMVCRRLADDPSANTTDIELDDLTANEFSFSERQKLLEAGISTYRLDSVGTLLVERVVTSYTENTDGERDTSYLDMQVVETVDAVRTYINSEARKRFKTWKLASTEENFGAGSKVMTPGVWRSFLAELYQSVFIQDKQWCQDFESYKNSIIVSIKKGSKTRLEYQHQPVLIGQFYIGAGLNQFK